MVAAPNMQSTLGAGATVSALPCASIPGCATRLFSGVSTAVSQLPERPVHSFSYLHGFGRTENSVPPRVLTDHDAGRVDASASGPPGVCLTTH